MSNPPAGNGPKDASRQAAAEWVIRMQGPDAERLRPAFEAWLSESPSHKRLYDNVAARWEQARLISQTPAGQAWQTPPALARVRRPVWAYALAASIVALLMIGVIVAQGTPNQAPKIASVRLLASPIGIRKVRLEDGSIVTLDAGARLMLRFSASERRIELETGRARFETAPDAARPFVVAANHREVMTTGTIFDVACEDGRLSVALLRGTLQIRNLKPGAGVLHLGPGQTIALSAGNAKPVTGVLRDTARDWPSGMVAFDATPLREVIATANRYSAQRIVLGDPAIGALRVTGGYRMGEPQALAATLAAAFGLRVEAGPGQSIVLRSARPDVS